jgi:hypothetical protein
MEGQRIDVQRPAEREATPKAKGGREGFISLEIKKEATDGELLEH